MAKILIIDDEAAIRENVCEFLVAGGHSVIEANNGAVGIQQIARNCVDIALVDMVMPCKDGVETIKEIRQMCPDVKIIAMSGRPYKDLYLSIARKMGADAVLAKPFQPAELGDAIAAALACDTALILC